MALTIGDEAPNFEAETTEGKIEELAQRAAEG